MGGSNVKTVIMMIYSPALRKLSVHTVYRHRNMH
jgi:hypothetical protein